MALSVGTVAAKTRSGVNGAVGHGTRIAHAPVVAEPVPALANAAEMLRTPCGDGSMVWRRWGQGTPLVLLLGAARGEGRFGCQQHQPRTASSCSVTCVAHASCPLI